MNHLMRITLAALMVVGPVAHSALAGRFCGGPCRPAPIATRPCRPVCTPAPVCCPAPAASPCGVPVSSSPCVSGCGESVVHGSSVMTGDAMPTPSGGSQMLPPVPTPAPPVVESEGSGMRGVAPAAAMEEEMVAPAAPAEEFVEDAPAPAEPAPLDPAPADMFGPVESP
ncbi:MAG: hypothetical protein AAGB00_06515, partial [Planctomycetota bacterium]